jgi:hypothetical protein
MIDLNSLIDPLAGWELISANALNESGQVAGSGLHRGEFRAFLLTPVPEPQSLALTVIGMCGLFLRGRNFAH